jgi:hypothetical protein
MGMRCLRLIMLTPVLATPNITDLAIAVGQGFQERYDIRNIRIA